jgi:peptide/nickel transport system substrate-binding protein
VPSLDDGTISILPDGRMRTVFHLRSGVTWHDGEPFTAHDLVFSYQVVAHRAIPNPSNEATRLIESVEAPDDWTFVVNYRSPYMHGAALGPYLFWPLPRHLLRPAYERFLASGDPGDVLNSTYWRSDYVHLGAFRLTQYDPGEALGFEAHERYFLGRPKVDSLKVRLFSDINAIVANLLAGTVDLVPSTVLRNDTALQLKERWEGSGGGMIHVLGSSLRTLVPQYRPTVQSEPAILERNVRTALLYALDRVALSDGVNGGNPQLVAYSLIPTRDQLSPAFYEVTRDALRPFGYEPERARAMLRDAGWTPGADGTLRHASDGRAFRTHLWSSLGLEREIAAYAIYWRQLGITVDEFTIPAARTRDGEFRSSYPGWESTGADALDQMARTPATAQNNWSGNPSGYDDGVARGLVDAFRTSVTEADQVRALKAISDYFVQDIPMIPIYFLAAYLAVRKGVVAFDDAAGGYTGQTRYGSFSRNAYLWDLRH